MPRCNRLRPNVLQRNSQPLPFEVIRQAIPPDAAPILDRDWIHKTIIAPQHKILARLAQPAP
jgi:hypothetical protein